MEKKVLFAAILMIATTFATKAWAYDFYAVTVGGDTLYYNISGNNVSVTFPGSVAYYAYDGFAQPTGNLEIPSSVTYNSTTYSVTSIGNCAFIGCSGLTSVTIPNSVTSIGDAAFYNCIGLTSVAIPNSVTSIGSNAFYNCYGLTSLTIGDSVTMIGEYAFGYCSGLTSMVVESGNTVYDSRENCNAIIETATNTLIAGCMSTTIPNSVTSIGDAAFYYCIGLTSVAIPNSVTSIGSYAFQNCTGLTSVTIPNSVSLIGEYAFSYCSGLTSMVVESGNTVYDSRENCNAIIEAATNTLIAGCMSTTIPNTVASIGDYAFSGCSGLTSVTIPNSVTSIGDDAFSVCIGLTSVTIPDSVTEIGRGAFGYCRGLTSVTIGSSVTSIGDYAFFGCSGLTEITSLATTAPIPGTDAFEGVSSTIPVNIPCGSLVSYYSHWSYFSNFVDNEGFSFSAQSADETMGSVSVLTQPTCEAPNAVIYATANDGYRFDHWSDGTTDNPYSLTVTQDTTLIAYFVSTQGIGDVDGMGSKVFAANDQIVVSGADGNTVTIYDAAGRILAIKQSNNQAIAFDIPATGTYLVKVGSAPARRVVVVR